MTWLISMLGGKVVAILGGAAALLLAVFGIRMDAKRDAKRELKEDDYENADDIRNRARSADKRLRKYDDAGWRD